METMQTIPGLLAGVGLIPTASAKPGRRNDVSEPLYGVLESSEMHPVKSMMTFPVLGGGGYTTTDCPHLQFCWTWIWQPDSCSHDFGLLEYKSLYLGPEPRGAEGDFSRCESQLHVCLATLVFINTISTALRSLLFFIFIFFSSFFKQSPMWELGPPLGPLTLCGQDIYGNAEGFSHWALPTASQVLLLRTRLRELQSPWVLW